MLTVLSYRRQDMQFFAETSQLGNTLQQNG